MTDIICCWYHCLYTSKETINKWQWQRQRQRQKDKWKWWQIKILSLIANPVRFYVRWYREREMGSNYNTTLSAASIYCSYYHHHSYNILPLLAFHKCIQIRTRRSNLFHLSVSKSAQKNGNWKCTHFVKSECSLHNNDFFPFYMWFCDERWDKLQRFQQSYFYHHAKQCLAWQAPSTSTIDVCSLTLFITAKNVMYTA